MRTFLHKFGLPIWLTLFLIASFALTAGLTYVASRDAIEQEISEQTLPIIADNLVAQMQATLSHASVIAAHIQHDSTLRNLLTSDEIDSAAVIRYLKEFKQKHGTSAVSLVAQGRSQYYDDRGQLKTLSASDPKDQWFYRLAQSKSPFDINVPGDMFNRDIGSLMIYCRVVDANGSVLGVVGFGLPQNAIKSQISALQNRTKSSIYFIDSKGEPVLAVAATGKAQDRAVASQRTTDIAARVIAIKKSGLQRLEYQNESQHESQHVLVNAYFIAELGWYLVIEQDDSGKIKPVQQSFLLTLIVDALISIIFLVVLIIVVRRYQRRLDKSAATDALTSLLNRQAFEFVFQQALLDSVRTRQPLCVAIVDIDFFKKINDKHGHLVGDHVLKEIAMIAKRSLRESDVICRWGGEEFLVLLKNCTLEKATSIAETLRATIEANDFSRTTDLAKKRLAVTVSMGVAQCKDDDTGDTVFERADVALSQAKESGRNSVYFSE